MKLKSKPNAKETKIFHDESILWLSYRVCTFCQFSNSPWFSYFPPDLEEIYLSKTWQECTKDGEEEQKISSGAKRSLLLTEAERNIFLLPVGAMLLLRVKEGLLSGACSHSGHNKHAPPSLECTRLNILLTCIVDYFTNDLLFSKYSFHQRTA